MRRPKPAHSQDSVLIGFVPLNRPSPTLGTLSAATGRTDIPLHPSQPQAILKPP